MIQLKYNNKNSYDDYGFIVKSVDRPILPTLRKREIVIPGRHGTWDFEGNTYENRIISVEFKYRGTTFNDLRLQARDIAQWLSQTIYKELIFSDEPDKYYLAKIYDSIGLQNILRAGQGSIRFECKPFAYKLTEDITSATITANGQTLAVVLAGTAETPEIITLTNQGSSISAFTLEIETLIL